MEQKKTNDKVAENYSLEKLNCSVLIYYNYVTEIVAEECIILEDFGENIIMHFLCPDVRDPHVFIPLIVQTWKFLRTSKHFQGAVRENRHVCRSVTSSWNYRLTGVNMRGYYPALFQLQFNIQIFNLLFIFACGMNDTLCNSSLRTGQADILWLNIKWLLAIYLINFVDYWVIFLLRELLMQWQEIKAYIYEFLLHSWKKRVLRKFSRNTKDSVICSLYNSYRG